jgi:hypothetical protein
MFEGDLQAAWDLVKWLIVVAYGLSLSLLLR